MGHWSDDGRQDGGQGTWDGCEEIRRHGTDDIGHIDMTDDMGQNSK